MNFYININHINLHQKTLPMSRSFLKYQDTCDGGLLLLVTQVNVRSCPAWTSSEFFVTFSPVGGTEKLNKF